MKKSLVIILIALLSNVVFATDNVEQMATTLGNSEQPTVGNNLLLNIKPKGATSSTSWEEPTSSNGGGSISIIGGQVKKGGTGSSGGATGGISSFSSGRRSSVSNVGASSPSSVSGGGPRKALGGGGSGTEEPEPGDRPDPYKDPIGAIPFALILMLAVGYGLYKKLIFDDGKPSS